MGTCLLNILVTIVTIVTIVSGNLINFFENYLSNRYQRVVLNGKESDWMNIKAGVPQGSVLGPLLFLIYISDLTDNIESDMRLFADDSSLFTCVKGITQTHDKLVNDVHTISTWVMAYYKHTASHYAF